jgi:hypothetical protein
MGILWTFHVQNHKIRKIYFSSSSNTAHRRGIDAGDSYLILGVGDHYGQAITGPTRFHCHGTDRPRRAVENRVKFTREKL